ncbi:MAG: DUF58 domain-containing protein [Bacteroidetes bacterium]|nr:DUF58 domain-containing protein [Bacteroidota bacterium]MBU1114760.1 DUF58 domain-containing protein [Bacteroidota bacterium]MBU1797783.1 DUF58 domain-containing protein [Bacteroidota bacterium]
MSESNQKLISRLDPTLISKLNSLELKAKTVVEGFKVGLHRSPYHGFSVEFSEHKAYMQGDPIKNIDWKVFGKSDKLFIKQYEEETNLTCHILLDISASMDYKNKGIISKLEYGKILAASLSYLMVSQQDSVGLSLYSDQIENYFPPRSTKIYLQTLLRGLENISPVNKTETAQCLNSIAEKVKKRGLVIIISDFFDNIDSILTALKHFKYKKNEVIVFQILDPIEKNFAFERDAIFVDIETKDELSTQPIQIQKAYQVAMNEFLDKLKSECLNNKIEYNQIDTKTPFDKALFSYFKKRTRLN